jgi:hypothetical protein
VQTLFSDRRAARNAVSAASRADAIADPQRVQSLAGFSKLVKGRHGCFLENENDVYVGRALIEYRELESQLLLEYCKPGDVVVDAHIGSPRLSSESEG